MAKRKKGSKNAKLVGFLGLAFAVVGVLLFMLLDALYVGDSDAAFEGYKLVFGYSSKTTVLGVTLTTNYFSLGIIPLIVILVALAGGILPVAMGKSMNFIGGILMLVACVAIFCITLYAPVGFGEFYNTLGADSGDCGLSVGTIIAGILFGLGGVANISSKFI